MGLNDTDNAGQGSSTNTDDLIGRAESALKNVTSGIPQDILDYFELSVATRGFKPAKFIEYAEMMADELRKRRALDAVVPDVVATLRRLRADNHAIKATGNDLMEMQSWQCQDLKAEIEALRAENRNLKGSLSIIANMQAGEAALLIECMREVALQALGKDGSDANGR